MGQGRVGLIGAAKACRIGCPRNRGRRRGRDRHPVRSSHRPSRTQPAARPISEWMRCLRTLRPARLLQKAVIFPTPVRRRRVALASSRRGDTERVADPRSQRHEASSSGPFPHPLFKSNAVATPLSDYRRGQYSQPGPSSIDVEAVNAAPTRRGAARYRPTTMKSDRFDPPLALRELDRHRAAAQLRPRSSPDGARAALRRGKRIETSRTSHLAP